MSLRRTLITSGAALTAQRLRMDIIANNIANANTTRTPEGGPYQRKRVVFMPREDSVAWTSSGHQRMGRGVQVDGIVEDQRPGPLVHDPSHPDADPDTGMVQMPNVDTVTEMVDMLAARRSYEANVVVIDATKAMASAALEIGR
ncbi:MAG: Flagellar basal-body rod protein FlgC [Anaerolineales bacterium]|nr:Flagellar basal-body rod protein FlgC [Anaerolineales bacterium]